MSTTRISEGLSSLFAQHAIVFWHDLDAEFESLLDQLQLGEVKLVKLDETPALRIKLDLERAPASQRWLIYSTQPEPLPAKDWLLGIRLRSKSFRADSMSILLGGCRT